MHFLNPVPIMKIVEVLRLLDQAIIAAKDTPGFVVDVLLVASLAGTLR